MTTFPGKDEVLKFRDGLYALQSKKRKREWVRPGVIHLPEIAVKKSQDGLNLILPLILEDSHQSMEFYIP